MSMRRIRLYSSNVLIHCITVCVLTVTHTTDVSAESWELRTAMDAVPGTREIESGDVDKSIRISEVQLPRVSPRKKAAVLNNLCIGYILRGDLGKASDYCSKAVERRSDKTVSHNNRGVLKALQGDIEGAIQDFKKAITSGCLGECSNGIRVPQDLPRPVARRNLARAEFVANALKPLEDDSLNVRADR